MLRERIINELARALGRRGLTAAEAQHDDDDKEGESDQRTDQRGGGGGCACFFGGRLVIPIPRISVLIKLYCLVLHRGYLESPIGCLRCIE